MLEMYYNIFYKQLLALIKKSEYLAFVIIYIFNKLK